MFVLLSASSVMAGLFKLKPVAAPAVILETQGMGKGKERTAMGYILVTPSIGQGVEGSRLRTVSHPF